METRTTNYSSLFYLSPFPQWVYEVSTFQILDANDAAVIQYGFSREEFLKLTIKDLRPTDEIPKMMAAHVDIDSRQGNIYFGVFTHHKKSGDIIRMKINGNKVDFQGKKCVLVVCQDVTEDERKALAIKESEERLRAASSIAKVGYWRQDLSTDTLTWSDEIFKIWERDRSTFEVSFNNFFESIHPDDRGQFTIEQKVTFEGGKDLDFVHRIFLPDGGIKWVHELGHLIKDQNGQPIIFEGTVQDITSQKEAELQLNRISEKLIESEAKFRTIFEIASLGIAQVDPAKGKIILVNSFYETITGYTTEELLQMNFVELTHPDDRERDWEVFSKALRGEGEYRNEKRYIRKGGSIVWVRLHVAFIKDELGKPIRSVAICEDISYRKAEEQRLKLLESVITNTSDSVLITEAEPFDEPGPRIVYVNEAFTKMTGYMAEEVIAKTPRILQGPKSDMVELAKLSKALRNWEPCEITTINYKKSGEEFWINFSVTPVANEKGWFTHWIAIERDVTEKKNQELEQNLLSQISLIFSEEKKLTDAAQRVCDTFADFGDFDFVEIWTPDLENTKIQLLSYSNHSSLAADFYDQTLKFRSFEFGEGLPGLVWESKRPLLLNSAENSGIIPRIKAAQQAGLKSFLGLPLLFNESIVGVLVFGSSKEPQGLGRFVKLFHRLETFIGSEINRKSLETNLQNLFEAIPDIICLADFQGRFLKMNKAGCELLGYSEEELLYHPFDEFVHPEDKNISTNEVQKLGDGETIFKFENRYMTKSGEIVWLSWTCNSEVEAGLIYASAKDISKEKKLSELNRLSSKLAKIGSWEIDVAGNRLFWSDMVFELHEADPAEFVPELATAINYYREDFRALVNEKVANAIKKGEAFDFEAVLVTLKNKERWVRVIGNTDFFEGKAIRVYGSFQDIQDRKESELRLKSISDNLPGVVFRYIINPDGTDAMRYVSRGAREIWGYTAEESIEDNNLIWNGIKAGGDFEVVRGSILESIKNKSKWTAKWRYMMPGGELRFHIGHGSPEYLTDGTVVFNSMILDSTAERKNEELLNQASAMARIGSWELDLVSQTGDAMFWSAMTREILGVGADYNPTLTGGFEFYTEDSKAVIQRAVDLLVREGKEFDEELHIITAQGDPRWIRCIGSGQWAGGKCVKIFGSYQDIHATKSLQLQLSEILGSISDAFYAMDKDWNFTYFNREAEELLLKKAENVLGKNIWQEFPAAIGTPLEAIYHQVAASGESKSFEYFFPGDNCWYEVNAYPSNGGVSAYFKNIDERKQDAEKLEKAYLEKNNIIESIADAFFTMDRNFIVSYWNRAAEELIGVKREQLIGKNLWEVFPDAMTLPSYTNYHQVLETGQPITFEDNYGLWLEVNAYPSEEGITVFFRDISLRKEADQRLLKAFEEKNTILESIGDAFFTVDRNWTVTYWNKEAELVLGKKRDAIVGKHLWEEYADAIDSDFYCQYHRAMETQKNISFEEHYPTLNKWFEVSVYPTENGLSVYFKDVTLRKEADLRLIKSLEERNTILERITEAFVALDSNWCYTHMNKKAGEIFNRDPQKMIGKHIWTEFPEGLNQPFHLAYEKAMATQQYVHVEEHYKPYDLWFENHIYPSPDGLSIFFRDISERKRSEENLRKANERFEKVTEATNDAIWDWDIENKTFFRSSGIEKLFGEKSSKSLIEADFWKDAFHPEDLSLIQQSIREAIEDPDIFRWEMEYRILKEDPEYCYVMDKGVIIRNEKGKALRMIGAMTDISDRKRHEVELLELNESLKKYAHELELTNEQLEQFAFIASHDLQEPLRMISSFLDQLKRKYSSQLDEKALQYIHFATDGAKRMKQIILDLLEYSRAGKFEENRGKVNLKLILDEYKSLRKKIIEEKSAGFIYTNLPIIEGFQAPIIQVIHCLLDNAIKYSRDNVPPLIEFAIEETNTEWFFTVRDNGLGIAPEFFDKIFVIFQRLHNRDQYGGSGIGLSIVKKQVESWGGKVWLESTLGEGSTFYFTIPKS